MAAFALFLIAQLLIIVPLILLLRGRMSSWPLWYLTLVCLDYLLVLRASYELISLLLLRVILGLTLLLLAQNRLRKRHRLRLRLRFLAPIFPQSQGGLAGWVTSGTAVALALGFFFNALTPPSGWDALTYHLEWPGQWLQGQIQNQTAFGDLSPPFYPALPQLFYGGALMGGSFRFADSLPVFLWFLLFWSLRGIALCLKKSTDLSVLIFALSPLCFSGILVAEADLLLTVLFAFCLWNFLLYQKTEHSYHLLHAGLAAGLMAACKYSGSLYAASLILWAFTVLRLRFKPLPLLPGLATGSFFYVRNFFWTGNPLYPAHLPLAGWTGLYDRDFYKSHEFHEFRFYDFLTDPHYAPLLLLCLIVVCYHLLKKRALPSLLPGLLLITIVFTVFYYIIPLRQLRQLMPLTVALYFLTIVASQKSVWLYRFMTLLLALQLVLAILRLAELYGPLDAPGINLTEFSRSTFKLLYRDAPVVLTFGGLFLLLILLQRLSGPRIFVLCTLGSSCLAFYLQSFSFYSDERTYFYRRLNSEQNVTIGVIGLNAVAALRGDGLKNRPFFLCPQNDTEAFQKADYLLIQKPYTHPHTALYRKIEEQGDQELWKRILRD
ncbi:MAG: hypothetical protein HS115_18470 [Spirochaetales bacterium]|nr:hypothetical protein [Spirochaetales bacterium]